MSDARIAAEAFGLTSDPDAYVPSAERERALAQMTSALAAGAVPCLEGPTGIGKSLMLQLLAQRVADRFDPLYVPYPMLSSAELCSFAIGLLGQGPAQDPEASLLRIAAERAARGRPLLLLIDDATSLPADSARGLAALRVQARGALCLALAGIGGRELLDAVSAFGATLKSVTLEERIPRAELRNYVAAQLDHASAPANLRSAFDDAVLEELERAASGNPRRLHLAAQSIVRRAESSAPAAAEPVETPVAAPAETPTVQPAPAPIPPPQRAAPAAPAEPIGAYRVVRKRPAAPPNEVGAPAPELRVEPPRPTPPPREARPAAPNAAPPLPPAEVDLTLAALSSAAPPPATPPWQASPAPTPARRAQAAPARATERAPRRAPGLPIILAVAVVSAALGFALASRLPHGASAPKPSAPQPEARVAEIPPPARPIPAPSPAPTASPAPAAPAPAPAARVEISINASPWAIVEIDGREVGETPLGGIAVERGPHRFVARFPDGRVVERTVEIDAAHRTLVFE